MATDRILDFGPGGMWWEITRSTADTGGELFEAVNVIKAGFGGPPLHIHPTAQESYAVQSGVLDVCVGGEWRQVKAGETAHVPAGVAHTLRNTSGTEVRLLNVHKPAQDFERFFRRLHALASAGRLTLPPKGLSQMVVVSMLFVEHEAEIRSVRPPHGLMWLLAWVGRVWGVKLPGGKDDPGGWHRSSVPSKSLRL